jgi:hypothetical protein
MRYGRYSRPFIRPLGALSPKGEDVIRPTLRDDVQTVFERACAEKDFEVAEHLLRALEAIACREKNEASLNIAYWVLVRCP